MIFFFNLSILLYKFHLHLKESPCCLGFMIMSNHNEVEFVSFKSYHVCVCSFSKTIFSLLNYISSNFKVCLHKK